MSKVINAAKLINTANRATARIGQLSRGFTAYSKLQKVQSRTIYRELRLRREALEKVAKKADKVGKVAEKAGKVTDHLQKGRYSKISSSFGRIMGFILPLIGIGLSVGNFLLLKLIQESDIRKLQVISTDLDRIANIQSRFNARIKTNTRRIESLNKDADFFNSQIINNRKLINSNLEINKILNSSIQGINISFSSRMTKLINGVNTSNAKFREQIKQLQKKVKFRSPSNGAINNAKININSQHIQQLKNQNKTFENRIIENAQNITINQKSIEVIRKTASSTSNSAISALKNQINLINQKLQQNKNADISAEVAKQLQPKIDSSLELDRLKARDLGRSLEKLEAKVKQPNIEPTVRNLIASSPQIQGLLAALKAANVKLDGYDIAFPVIADNLSNNITSVQIIDGKITKLERGVEVKGLNIVNARISGAESAINALKADNQKINTQLKEKQTVDQNQFNQLIERLTVLPPLIAAVPNNTVRQMPKPLTAPQIEAAATAGVCRSTAPGGCMSNALGGAADTINQNTNKVGNNLLDKINAGANAAQLALLRVIDNKLGSQIANGGISNAIKNIFENKLVDRAMSVVTLATTMHNALMLSNSLGQTLFSATDNILKVFGVQIKDEKGAEIGIQKVVDSLLLNFANTLFGAENVKVLNANLKKANRIYQSGANIVNSVRSMTDSVRNITEFTAENTGKIGNALKTYQVIAPDAYKWMPEQVNGQSIWVQRLQNLEEAASGIEMVSSEVLQIQENVKEIVEQKQEFDKAIEELAPKERVDNKPVAEKVTAQKTASTAPQVPEVTANTFNEVSA